MPRRRPHLAAFAALLLPGLVGVSLIASPAQAVDEPLRPATLQTGSTPDTRPFPDDAFTVADTAQLTGRRVNLPTPGCAAQASAACDQLALLNTLDGFDVRPRVSVPFTDPIDLRSVTAAGIRIEGPGGFVTPLVQLVADPAQNAVTGYPRDYLAPATTYSLVVDGRTLRTAAGGGVSAQASVRFTTLSSTSVLDSLRAALDDGSAYDAAGIPAADRTLRFDTATDGARSVFPASGTVVTASNQVRADGSSPQAGPVPNTALSYASYGFGSITSPQYLRPDATLARQPSKAGRTPAGKARLGVVMLAPPAPQAGQPCLKPVIFGHGFTRSKLDVFLAANALGASGLAVFATDVPGHGFGASSTYTVTIGGPTGPARTGELLGRGRDLNGDGTIDSTEGVSAGGSNASLGSSDGLIQAVVDNMALVRALEKGVDVDGDGTVDTCAGARAVSYYGQSFGGIYGTMLLGTDPNVRTGVPNVAGGPVSQITQLGAFRPLLAQLLAGPPNLLNGGPGLVGFTESLPLRRDPAVSDPRQGAVPIQRFLAQATWLQRRGSPETYAPRLGAGGQFADKNVLFQVAYGDGTVPNPTSGEILRAGGLYDRAWVYRNDRTANATSDPHGFLLNPFLPASGQGQAQVRALLATGTEIDPDGPAGQVWEPATVRLGATPSTDYRVQLDCLHYPHPQSGQGQTRTAPAAECTDRSGEVAPANPPTQDRLVALPLAKRVLDSRIGLGTSRGEKTGLVRLDLSSVVPDAGASSAVLNVTVLNARTRGYVVAFPAGSPQPPTSNVNVEASVPGRLANTQANEVVVRMNGERQVDLFLQPTAQVVVDVVGYLTPNANAGAGRISPLSPQRLLDTRTTSTPQRTGAVVVDLAGTPAATATAVLLNVTATRTSGRGFVVAHPSGTAKPETSNVNYERGQTQANEVLVPVGEDGKVVLDVSTAASLVVDLVGRVETPDSPLGSDYRALAAPQRLLDTRSGTRVSTTRPLDVTPAVPATATAVVLNVTAVGADRPGYVTVFPTGTPVPGTSNVNFTAGAIQANEVLTGVRDGRVTLLVGGARNPSTHLVVDVVGYLTAPG